MNRSQVTTTKIQDFTDCVYNLYLTEASWGGDYFSWTNKQLGDDRIYRGIDRTLGNAERMTQYGDALTHYGEIYFSGYAPMIMSLHVRVQHIKSPFKFFDVWAEHTKFMPIIEVVWKDKTTNGEMKLI